MDGGYFTIFCCFQSSIHSQYPLQYIIYLWNKGRNLWRNYQLRLYTTTAITVKVAFNLTVFIPNPNTFWWILRGFAVSKHHNFTNCHHVTRLKDKKMFPSFIWQVFQWIIMLHAKVILYFMACHWQMRLGEWESANGNGRKSSKLILLVSRTEVNQIQYRTKP